MSRGMALGLSWPKNKTGYACPAVREKRRGPAHESAQVLRCYRQTGGRVGTCGSEARRPISDRIVRARAGTPRMRRRTSFPGKWLRDARPARSLQLDWDETNDKPKSSRGVRWDVVERA